MPTIENRGGGGGGGGDCSGGLMMSISVSADSDDEKEELEKKDEKDEKEDEEKKGENVKTICDEICLGALDLILEAQKPPHPVWQYEAGPGNGSSPSGIICFSQCSPGFNAWIEATYQAHESSSRNGLLSIYPFLPTPSDILDGTGGGEPSNLEVVFEPTNNKIYQQNIGTHRIRLLRRTGGGGGGGGDDLLHRGDAFAIPISTVFAYRAARPTFYDLLQGQQQHHDINRPKSKSYKDCLLRLPGLGKPSQRRLQCLRDFVVALFDRTWNEDHQFGQSPIVRPQPHNVTVDLIINANTNAKYKLTRDDLESILEHSTIGEQTCERFVFHGSNHRAIQNIILHGFRQDFNKTSLYGIGNYFASTASYCDAAGYAKPDRKGRQRVLLCRIITNGMALGREDARANDLTPWPGIKLPGGASVPPITFVDDLANPFIFVVGDNYALPLARITY